MRSKLFCCLLMVFSIGFQLHSQNNNLSKKEQRTVLKEAEAYFTEKDYESAAELFTQLSNSKPTDSYYRLMQGVSYSFIPNKAKESLQILQELKKENPSFAPINFHLGRAYAANGKFEHALKSFQNYLKVDDLSDKEIEQTETYIRNCESAIELMSDSLKVKITNIGSPVNTEYEEYVPIISPDKSILIFTYRGIKSTGGKRDHKGRPDSNGEYNEDVLISYKHEGQWSEPENIGKNINTDEQDASVALSISGDKLFIYKSTEENREGDIYMSKLEMGIWSVPEKLKGEINSPYWEGSLSMTADEKIIYFASERPGGFGGRDLWKVEKLSDGSWGNLQNLGSAINTIYDEDAPFIHPDGKTMYFSSKGHNSMGGYDIFYTYLEDQSWDPAGNIGYPINSFFDDRYYVLTADGKEGYYSSAGSYSYMGGNDILKVKPGHFGNKPVVALIAEVDSLESNPSLVKLIDSSEIDLNKKAQYTLSITPGNKYKIAIEEEGLASNIKYLNVSSYETYIDKEKEEEYIAGYSDTNKLYDKKQGSLNTFDTGEKFFTDKLKIKGLGFKLEIMSARDSQEVDLQKFSKYGKVYSKSYSDGVTRYFYGNFATLEETEEFKRKMYLEQADIASELLTVFVLEDEKNAPLQFIEEANSAAIAQSDCRAGGLDQYASFILKKLPDDNNYQRMLNYIGSFCSEDLTFEVQIAAYRKPKNYNYDFLEGLGKVKIRDYPDDITRFTQGSFLTFAQAEKMRKQIIEKGQEDAWITPFFQGRRFTMKELISGEFSELLKVFPSNRIPNRSQELWF